MYNEKTIHHHRSRRNRQSLAMRPMAMMTVIILAAIILPMILPASTEAMERVQVVTVNVEKGDSLWTIADHYDNNSMDLREYIELIQSFNHMQSPVLQPGQKIRIPVYSCRN